MILQRAIWILFFDKIFLVIDANLLGGYNPHLFVPRRITWGAKQVGDKSCASVCELPSGETSHHLELSRLLFHLSWTISGPWLSSWRMSLTLVSQSHPPTPNSRYPWLALKSNFGRRRIFQKRPNMTASGSSRKRRVLAGINRAARRFRLASMNLSTLVFVSVENGKATSW